MLHTHGGFLCQVWFCTFTLLSLLSPPQPWFCSQAFSRACRTSCVLELSGFGCRCQDASNKKNYQVARSKQIEKQLRFTQCIVRLFSLSVLWKWTSVQKATEHICERIQSRTIKHKDTASYSRDPWSSVGRRRKLFSSYSWEQRIFDSFSGRWMDQDQLPKYRRVRRGSLDWLPSDHSDHLKAPYRSEDVTWECDLDPCYSRLTNAHLRSCQAYPYSVIAHCACSALNHKSRDLRRFLWKSLLCWESLLLSQVRVWFL